MIVIDSREPVDVLAWGDKIELMQYGDIVLRQGNVDYKIERKTPEGYVGDLKSGRLDQQLAGCQALLIDLRRTRFDFDYRYTGHLDEWFDKLNGTASHHTVYFTFSDKQAVDMFRRYDEKLRLGKLGTLKVPVVKRAGLNPSVRILSNFEGIGVDKATILLKVYKSLDGVFNAASNGETLPGIGQGTNDKICNRLKEIVEL
jgi:ERCC4-type nuclease